MRLLQLLLFGLLRVAGQPALQPLAEPLPEPGPEVELRLRVVGHAGA